MQILGLDPLKKTPSRPFGARTISWIIFTMIVLIMTVYFVVTYKSLTSLTSSFENLYFKELASIKAVNDIGDQARDIGFNMAAYASDVIQANVALKRLHDSKKRMDEEWRKYRQELNPEVDPELDNIEQGLSRAEFLIDRLAWSYELNDKKTVTQLVQSTLPDMVKFIIDPVDKLEQRHSIQIKGSVDHIQDLARSILIIEIALFASGICLVGCAALLMNSLHIKYDRQVEDSLINSKLASLGEVSAVVAHEINNPATVIKGFSELIQWQLNEPNPDLPTIRKLANDTEKAADRLLRIISGVKNLGRRGENDAFEPASLKTIVEDATMFCDGKLKKYGIDLSVQMPHEGLVLFCRPVEISQVLLNLINNACDAIETLPEKWIIIEVHDDPKTVKILVRDSGKGIPRDIQTKLFDSFYTTKAAGRGTGLGLSINLKIIRAHMGKLFIDNLCPNTQFVIELPKSMAGHEVKSNLT